MISIWSGLSQPEEHAARLRVTMGRLHHDGSTNNPSSHVGQSVPTLPSSDRHCTVAILLEIFSKRGRAIRSVSRATRSSECVILARHHMAAVRKALFPGSSPCGLNDPSRPSVLRVPTEFRNGPGAMTARRVRTGDRAPQHYWTTAGKRCRVRHFRSPRRSPNHSPTPGKSSRDNSADPACDPTNPAAHVKCHRREAMDGEVTCCR